MAAAQKLIRLIEQHRTTQGDVETAVGLPQGRISKWSTGQGEPTIGQALNLARWFGVLLESLADDEVDELIVEDARGDIRTITSIIGVMGTGEAVRRLLLMSGSPSGPREVAAGDQQVATREKPARVYRKRVRLVDAEEMPDETEPRQPAESATPSELATGHQQLATPEKPAGFARKRQRSIDT
jgi:transcriptional regulator with XRE-family HTH domain